MRQIFSALLLAQLALLWPVGSLTLHDQVQEAALLPQPPILEADYLLDSAARWYLPAGGEARRETKGWFLCGTPLLQFLERYGDRLVDEAELVRRAHWLAGFAGPTEVGEYAQVPRQCRTPGCAGKVSLALAAWPWIEDDAGYRDYRELDDTFSLDDKGIEIRPVMPDAPPQRKKRRQRGRRPSRAGDLPFPELPPSFLGLRAITPKRL